MRDNRSLKIECLSLPGYGKQPSEFGDEKTESVACLEKLREPIRASDMMNGTFLLL